LLPTLVRAKLARDDKMCHDPHMSTTGKTKARPVARVPVTTMEEVVILSKEERTHMIASLEAAEQRIASGDYVEHNAETFVDEMIAIRVTAVRDKKE
jgi:hypothetical protein